MPKLSHSSPPPGEGLARRVRRGDGEGTAAVPHGAGRTQVALQDDDHSLHGQVALRDQPGEG